MYWQKRFNRKNTNEALELEIQEIFTNNNGNYGYRRIVAELKNRGKIVNHKKVQRIKKKLDLQSLKFKRKSRKYSSYKGNVGVVTRNLINRRFKTSVPHQKIVTDTTEFKYYEKNSTGTMVIKKAYLDLFLDMYNSEVISFRLSERPNAIAISEALNEAIKQTDDCKYRRTFHSDQGWAYQMKSYVTCLKNAKIFQSMSRKGNCLDNSVMENFFGIMKQEMYYGMVYESYSSLKSAIEKYIFYYNTKRIKTKLGCSPLQYRLGNVA